MFHCRDDEPSEPIPQGLGNTPECYVVGFAPPTREDDFSGIASQERGYVLPGLIHETSCIAPVSMIAGWISETLAQDPIHDIRNLRGNRSRGVVIQVDDVRQKTGF
jgi:hypothetical protein